MELDPYVILESFPIVSAHPVLQYLILLQTLVDAVFTIVNKHSIAITDKARLGVMARKSHRGVNTLGH